MWSSKWYHRLRFEVFALIFLFLVFTLGIIGTTYILLDQQTKIAKSLDTATSQSRILAELELAINAYLNPDQSTEEAKATKQIIMITSKQFEENMLSIAYAMSAYSFGDKLETTHGTLTNTCTTVNGQWDEIQINLEQFMDTAETASSNERLQLNIEAQELADLLHQLKANTVVSSNALRTHFMDKAESIKSIQWFIFGLAIVTLFIVLYLAEKLILSPMRLIIKMMKEIASGEGDLRQRLTVVGKSEVGEMAYWFNHFVGKLCKMMTSNIEQINSLGVSTQNLETQSKQMESNSNVILSELDTIASASEEMSINIKQVSDTADNASDNVTSVSSAIEELSANFQTVASAAEEASTNMAGIDKNIDLIASEIKLVNTSMDQIADSMEDISINTREAIDLTSKVTQSSKLSVDSMTALGDTAQNIDKVVTLIDSIASQTNMLALNATIEAASAGDSGKGFAVVVEEVKILALETARANRDIADRIEEIQELTDDSVKHTKRAHEELAQVEKINTLISNTVAAKSRDVQEVNSKVNSIDESTQESSMNLKEAVSGIQEITRNVAQASKASNESTRNLGEASIGVQEIARSTEEAVLAANNVSASLGNVKGQLANFDQGIEENRKSTETLSELTIELNKSVNQFKTR